MVNPSDSNYIATVRRLAEQGDVDSQLILASSYKLGKHGVAKNDCESAKWLRKAAEHGHAQAQYLLGWCYKDGLGVTKDEREADRWFIKAAQQGDKDAIELVATIQHKRTLEAGLAAAQRYDNAMNKLSSEELCEYGCRSLKEGKEQEAVGLFSEAAKRGYADGQFFLACCYNFGQGVSKDREEAVKWLRKAASQGHAEAKEMLRSVSNTMRYESGIEDLRNR